jgi:hypothetical protein
MHRIEPIIPKEIQWAEKLVHLMDDQFEIPIIKFKFGLDPIIGLIPWAGDLVTFAISALIIKALYDEGLPKSLIGKMVLTIVVDLIIGSIPVIGDIWDFVFKANRKNLKLAREYFENQSIAESSTAHRHPTT